MNIGPIWQTPAGILYTAQESVVMHTAVVATGTGVTYKIISGKLPSGLTMSTLGSIDGTPDPVLNVTNSKFVVRATDANGVVADRSFNIDVYGQDTPNWITTSGYLTVGIAGEKYALNNQYVNYKLHAAPIESPLNTKLKYFIGNGGGELPPGLSLSDNGTISGFLTDSLVFDGLQSATGGYDDESYDGYSYDHFADTTSTSIGLPKIYNFKVTATDGVANTSSIFKILVVNPAMIRDLSAVPVQWPAGVITTNSVYIPPLQFIKGTDLGIVRANNSQDIDVSAYNPYPKTGAVFYSITTTTDELTQLPADLKLDTNKGLIYGLIPYQPAYTKTYTLTINATRLATTTSNFTTASSFTSTFGLVTSTNVFTLAVKGEVESTIEWVSPSSLGTIQTGIPCELYVQARQLLSDYTIKYRQTSGTLPPGLTLERDGTFSGAVTHDAVGTYTFGIEASDVYGLSAVSRQFTVAIAQTDTKEYTKIYVRPFLSEKQRSTYQDFITNEFTFDPTLMYRYYDPNFGIQNNIRMVLEFGIEKVNLSDYTNALRENFYRKRLYFGDVKVAQAKDSTGTVIYEVVYVDVVDDQVNSAGQSASPILYSKENIYYAASVENMRSNLETVVLPNNAYIATNNDYFPRFMKTAQSGSYQLAGYMKVVPLCYVLPGNGAKILSRIKLSGFDFKTLDFEIDRLIVESSLDSASAKYLIFERQSIGDRTAGDDFLFGPDEVLVGIGENNTDSAIVLETGNTLTDENGNPLLGFGY